MNISIYEPPLKPLFVTRLWGYCLDRGLQDYSVLLKG